MLERFLRHSVDVMFIYIHITFGGGRTKDDPSDERSFLLHMNVRGVTVIDNAQRVGRAAITLGIDTLITSILVNSLHVALDTMIILEWWRFDP